MFSFLGLSSYYDEEEFIKCFYSPEKAKLLLEALAEQRKRERAEAAAARAAEAAAREARAEAYYQEWARLHAQPIEEKAADFDAACMRILARNKPSPT